MQVNKNPTIKEVNKKAVCKCAYCGQVIEICTRDNPCPICGSSLFTVVYKS